MTPHQHDTVYRTLRRLGRQFQALRDAVLILDKEGFVADSNRAAAAVFAGNKSALRRRHWSDLIPLEGYGNGSGRPAPCLGTARPQVLSARRLSGEEFPVEVTLSEYEFEKGDGAATVVVVRDLSDRQRMIDIAVHRDRLAAVGEATAKVAHGLSNPLTGITTLVEEMLRGCGARDRELLELIKDEAERASAMVHELLYFSRRDDLTHAIRLNDAVERAIELFELRNPHFGIEIVRELTDADTTVQCGSCEIEQLAINLLENAAQALEQRASGRITVRTRLQNGAVVLEVSDDGAGIPADVQDRIFEPFFTTKDAGAGTGLGLAIVAKIIRECGGRIDVRSEPGQGSTFLLSFTRAA